MNRYLLDTSILIWWLYDDENLHSEHRKIIASNENEIFVSVASIWEIEIKKKLNKLQISDRYYEAINDNSFSLIDINANHVLATSKLEDIHKDPFDCVIMAQGKEEKLILLSSDAIIKQYDISQINTSR